MPHYGPAASVDFPLPIDAATIALPITGYLGAPPVPSMPVRSRLDRIQLFREIQNRVVSVAVDEEPLGYHLKLSGIPDSDEIVLAFDGTTWYKRTVPPQQANLGGDCLIMQCDIDEGLRLSLEALSNEVVVES